MMFKYVLIIFLLFFNFSTKGEESLLTLKQQLDRLQREVNDLSKLYYQKNSKDVNNNTESNSENSINVTAFDMRIYDIEKDIKTLNSNFEDLVFQIDELKNLYEKLLIKVEISSINNNETFETTEVSDEIDNNEIDENTVLPENTLGTLKINSEDLSNINTEEAKNNSNTEADNLSPDEQFQLAFDLLRSQKFDQATKSLKEFILNNSDNELSGPAHYWLGEIHLLKKNYREAALVFAEGYQKFPSGLKAPNSLYKLAETLIKIDKTKEACNTLRKFAKEHADHKLIEKTNNKISELKCE